MHGDEVFLDSAYRALLGRTPDAAGRATYLARLKLGAARTEILGDIRYSPEGVRFAQPVTGLRLPYLWYRTRRVRLIGRLLRVVGVPRAVTASAGGDASTAVALPRSAADVGPAVAPEALAAAYFDGLMELNDAAFIDAAYRALLGRDPDHGGRVAHLARLRSGVARIDIVRSFEQSPEGCAARTAGRRQMDWRRVAAALPPAAWLPDAPSKQGPGEPCSLTPAGKHGVGDTHAETGPPLARLTAQWPRGVRRNG